MLAPFTCLGARFQACKMKHVDSFACDAKVYCEETRRRLYGRMISGVGLSLTRCLKVLDLKVLGAFYGKGER